MGHFLGADPAEAASKMALISTLTTSLRNLTKVLNSGDRDKAIDKAKIGSSLVTDFSISTIYGMMTMAFFGKNRAAGQQQKQKAGGASLFDFDFGDMFGGSSIFNDDLHDNMHRSFHQQAHSNSQNSNSGGSRGSGGQSCRTVTQRFGNTVTTFTQCS